MNMMGLGLVHIYGAFLLFGVGYAILVTLLGNLGGDHGGDAPGDAGDFDVGHDVGGGHDAAHGDTGDTGEGSAGLSPFSPLMIATFATLFGGLGFITLGIFGSIPLMPQIVSNGVSVIISAALAVILSSYFSFFLVKLFVKTETGGMTSTSRLIGCEAEASLDIVPGKMGEITYLHGGSRQNGMAMLVEGSQPVKRGQCVEIVAIRESVMYVKPVEPPPAM